MKTSTIFEIIAAAFFAVCLFFVILAFKSGNGEYEIVIAGIFAIVSVVFILLFSNAKNKELGK